MLPLIHKKNPWRVRLFSLLRWWFPLHLAVALAVLVALKLSAVSALLWPFAGLLLFLLHLFAKDQSERLALAESGLILQRTLCGLVEGGMALPAALARLTEAERNSRRVTQSLHRLLAGASLKESLQRLEASHRGSPVEWVWRAVGLAQDRNASIASALRGLLPLVEKWLLLEQSLWNLRKGVALQVGLAVALPWVLALFFRYAEPSVEKAVAAFPLWWGVAGGAMLWQALGAVLAWRCSSFFLKRRHRADSDRLQFLALLLVLLECGYDIRYAWKSASGDLPLFKTRDSDGAEGLGESGLGPFLDRWAEREEEATDRFWWRGLRDLYQAQSPLVPYLRAWAQHQEAKLFRKMAEHIRRVPTELNLLMIVFNLPPLFALLFGPLLLSVVDSTN